MSQTSGIERRVHPRYPLAESVEFFHGPTRRDFPALCRDISHGGMLMYVPAATPVAPGQSVRLRVAGGLRPPVAELSGQVIHATVVRVDRGALLTGGHIALAVRFVGTSS
ncbi:MAG: PilZ domain-containing protein [Planctomycetota bacterium]|nr:PilZ domain-containing protein [Planctomycetota bacterium]